MYKKFYIVLPVMQSCSNTFYDWKYAFSPSERLFKCKKYFCAQKIIVTNVVVAVHLKVFIFIPEKESKKFTFR